MLGPKMRATMRVVCEFLSRVKSGVKSGVNLKRAAFACLVLSFFFLHAVFSETEPSVRFLRFEKQRRHSNWLRMRAWVAAISTMLPRGTIGSAHATREFGDASDEASKVPTATLILS